MFDPRRSKGVVVVVQLVEFSSHRKSEIFSARGSTPPHHAQWVPAAERAHRVDDLRRGIGCRQLASGEQTMADDLPLVVADSLARNQMSQPLYDALSELLGIFGRMRVVDQRKRISHVFAAEARHPSRIDPGLLARKYEERRIAGARTSNESRSEGNEERTVMAGKRIPGLAALVALALAIAGSTSENLEPFFVGEHGRAVEPDRRGHGRRLGHPAAGKFPIHGLRRCGRLRRRRRDRGRLRALRSSDRRRPRGIGRRGDSRSGIPNALGLLPTGGVQPSLAAGRIRFCLGVRPRLDALYVEALAAIPPGQARTDGQAVGLQAANDIIAVRGGDGRMTPISVTSSFPTLRRAPACGALPRRSSRRRRPG